MLVRIARKGNFKTSSVMINEIFTDIEVIEGFVKSEFIDGKINKDTTKEILRLTQEIKDKITSK